MSTGRSTLLASRARAFLSTLLATAGILAFAAAISVGAVVSPGTVVNPTLASKCGLNVMLVLDESGSISQDNQTTTVRNAAKAFVGALSDTGSKVGIIEFNGHARFPVAYTAVTPASNTSTFNPYIDATGGGEGYDPSAYSGNEMYTNWEAALQKVQDANAALPKADLVVFITDGDPTAYFNGNTLVTGTSSSTMATALAQAAPHADALKTAGSHMFVVGVGAAVTDSTSEGRLKAISGDQKYPNPQANFAQGDYTLVSDFANLQVSLKSIATELCQSSVTITKLADTGNGQGYQLAAGFEFTGTVTVPANESFTWTQPAPPSPQTARSATTGANGIATFQWKPSGTSSSIQIVETQKSDYQFDSVACNKNGSPIANVTQSATFTLSLLKSDIVTCTVKNSKKGKLTVIKHVINDNGGTTTAGDFTMTVDDPGTNPAGFPGAESPGTDVTVDPGAYSVSESGPSGYAASYSADCTGSIAIGQTKTCTVTNNDIAPELHLRKVVVNDNGGTATVADFTLTADGTDANDLSGTSPVDSGATLQADTWTLSETNVAGYSASDWSCDGGTYAKDNQGVETIHVGLGGSATCTITNTALIPDLKIEKIGPAQVNFGETITYQIAVSNVGDPLPIPASFIKVTDPKVTPDPLVYVSGDTAPADGFLNVGETWIYEVAVPQSETTIPATLTGSTCGDIPNTAIVELVVPTRNGEQILVVIPQEVNLANNESTVTTKVICTLDLGIQKTSDKDVYDAGQTINYTVTVTNNGQQAIPFSQIQVSDPQATLTLQGAAPADLAPGASLVYTAQKATTTTDCAQVVNTATVTYTGPNGPETTTANNSATRTVSVVCPAPPVVIAGTPAKLAIDKRGPLAATAGQLVTYRIKVTNTGQQDALNVVIRDTLPSGFTLARRAAGATFKGGVVTWKVGTLAVGKSKTVKLTVRIDKAIGGRRCNTGSARGSNVGQVRDAACTRIKAIAPVITPAVTG